MKKTRPRKSQIQFSNPLKAPTTLPLSHMAIAGDFMYTFGDGHLFDKENPLPGMRKVFMNMKKLLATKKLTFKDVVKTTVLLSPGTYFPEYSKLYAEYFKAPHPCRTTIPVTTDKHFLEIDIVAYRKGLSDE